MTLSSTIAVHFAVTLEKRRIFNERYPNTFKALAHYTQNCSYHPYTLQPFFTTVTIFSTVLCIGNDFHNKFSRKISAVLCEVCEGLYCANSMLPADTWVLIWNEPLYGQITMVTSQFTIVFGTRECIKFGKGGTASAVLEMVST